MKEDYPRLKHQRQPVTKTQEELYQEALKVKTLIADMPPMPQKEGEIYHIVAMDWFKSWKAYTGYSKVKLP
jgi:hypothetical protein